MLTGTQAVLTDSLLGQLLYKYQGHFSDMFRSPKSLVIWTRTRSLGQVRRASQISHGESFSRQVAATVPVESSAGS